MIFGMTTFGFLDYLTNTIMLPLGGLLITIFGAYVIGYENLSKQILLGSSKSKIGAHWKFMQLSSASIKCKYQVQVSSASIKCKLSEAIVGKLSLIHI